MSPSRGTVHSPENTKHAKPRMKFLHTADWHLGRYLHGRSLLEDQAHVLEQFIELARTEAVDAVVIAGDVYDRSIPPAEAVALLDAVLSRLVVDCGIPVILIAGNHDSAERIGFGGRISEGQGLYLRGTLNRLEPVVLADAHGEVAFYPLPYVEPLYARALPGGEAVTDHQSALNHIVSGLRETFVPGRRHVLVGHAFVTGGSESESERPLSVGGSGMVAADTFAGFDFVALGHLHRPQAVGYECIHYSGSLLKYSFNEVDHAKSVSVVELNGEEAPAVRRVALTPLRDVRILRSTLQGLLTAPDPTLSREDYLRADLTDNSPLLDPMARLREVYPNMLELQFVQATIEGGGARAAGDHRQRQPADLFQAFYRDVMQEELGKAELDAFKASLGALETDEAMPTVGVAA